MRRFRFTFKDSGEWCFSLNISGTTIGIVPRDNGAILAAVKDLKAVMPMDIPDGEGKAVHVELRERDGAGVARILAAIVQARERVELEIEELP